MNDAGWGHVGCLLEEAFVRFDLVEPKESTRLRKNSIAGRGARGQSKERGEDKVHRVRQRWLRVRQARVSPQRARDDLPSHVSRVTDATGREKTPVGLQMQSRIRMNISSTKRPLCSSARYIYYPSNPRISSISVAGLHSALFC